MNRRTKQILKVVILIAGIFIFEGIALGLVNLNPPEYFTPRTVNGYKEDFYQFGQTHRNTTGLFIEPTMEANYHASHSINRTESQLASSPIRDPLSNASLAEWDYNYLFEKQNEDGGHSDAAGSGSIMSSFHVVSTIDFLNDTWLNQTKHTESIDLLIDFLNDTLNEDGEGFKENVQTNESDIHSTYYGVALAHRFGLNDLLNNYTTNITNYVNNLRVGGYLRSASSGNPDPESTYYAIQTVLSLGYTYDALETGQLSSYLNSLFNTTTAGYAPLPGDTSDVESTYFTLASMYTLGLTVPNVTETLDFITRCQTLRGGFQKLDVSEDPDGTETFKAGWTGSNALRLLRDYEGRVITDNITDYYTWLSEFQALNALFGHISVESNYWGVRSSHLMGYADNINYTSKVNITQFLDQCYDPVHGGIGATPGENSSLSSTYAALETYDMMGVLINFTSNNLKRNKTIEFIVSQQNDDGGFKMGNDTSTLETLGVLAGFSNTTTYDTNESSTQSTFFAMASLFKLNARFAANRTTLIHWLRAGQNPDGGYGNQIGYHSDVTSSYYALNTIQLLGQNPMSKIALTEFIKNAQTTDGGFAPLPLLASYLDSSPSFSVTFMASRSLYDLNSQPEDVVLLTEWFEGCYSQTTESIGDTPGFGADLRNVADAIEIIDEIRIDQGFDPTPWNRMITTVLIIESALLLLFLIFRMFAVIGISITKRVKDTLKIGKRFNVAYLQQFPAINCENLTIFAGGKTIIDQLSLKLEHGQILGVLGESGAGKSTFVKAILGMRKFTGVNEVYGMDIKKNASRIRPLYGYVPQDLSKIYHDFTVMDNLMYFGLQYGLTEREILRKGRRLLRSLEIEEKENEFIRNLSGGQKRRASIAIALIHSPIFCVLDEPTSGLDPVIRENLWLALTDLNEQFNTTLIVISHYPEESRFCHAVAIFGRNRGLIDYGHPKELLNQMPGGGRAIHLTFKEIHEDAGEKLEQIEGIEKALEIEVGQHFAVYSDDNLLELEAKISNIFGGGSIQSLNQSDAKMESYFRYKSMEVPDLD